MFLSPQQTLHHIREASPLRFCLTRSSRPLTMTSMMTESQLLPFVRGHSGTNLGYCHVWFASSPLCVETSPECSWWPISFSGHFIGSALLHSFQSVMSFTHWQTDCSAGCFEKPQKLAANHISIRPLCTRDSGGMRQPMYAITKNAIAS